MHIVLFSAGDPVLDAWHGAREWAHDTLHTKKHFVTRAEYEEKGGEYLIEHCASNMLRK